MRHLVDFSLFKAVILFCKACDFTIRVNAQHFQQQLYHVNRQRLDQNQMVVVQTKTPLRINVTISFTSLKKLNIPPYTPHALSASLLFHVRHHSLAGSTVLSEFCQKRKVLLKRCRDILHLNKSLGGGEKAPESITREC